MDVDALACRACRWCQGANHNHGFGQQCTEPVSVGVSTLASITKIMPMLPVADVHAYRLSTSHALTHGICINHWSKPLCMSHRDHAMAISQSRKCAHFHPQLAKAARTALAVQDKKRCWSRGQLAETLNNDLCETLCLKQSQKHLCWA